MPHLTRDQLVDIVLLSMDALEAASDLLAHVEIPNDYMPMVAKYQRLFDAKLAKLTEMYKAIHEKV